MSLSLLAILLGVLTIAISLGGLLQPASYSAAARRFPRWTPIGVVLMLLATGWFLYYVSLESVADFANIKKFLLLLFAGVGIGSCFVVQDFLPVRGLACLLLLAARLMVDTGRPWLGHTPWVYLIQTWAYVWVIAGIWLTVAPWRLRDWLNWATADAGRLRLILGAKVALGLLTLGLGLTVFRTA